MCLMARKPDWIVWEQQSHRSACAYGQSDQPELFAFFGSILSPLDTSKIPIQ